MAMLSGIATAMALVGFLAIVWWAFSQGRAQANQEASMLPFALPDEPRHEKKVGGSHE